MAYLLITKVDNNGQIQKYNKFKTYEEAEAQLSKPFKDNQTVHEAFPDAFIVEDLGESNPLNYTVTANQEIIIDKIKIDNKLLNDGKKRITNMIQALSIEIRGSVPEDEVASWPTKEKAARNFLANTAGSHEQAMLYAETLMTGETLEEISTRIVQNSDNYLQIIASLTGIRRNFMNALDAKAAAGGDIDDYRAIIKSCEQACIDFKISIGLTHNFFNRALRLSINTNVGTPSLTIK